MYIAYPSRKNRFPKKNIISTRIFIISSTSSVNECPSRIVIDSLTQSYYYTTNALIIFFSLFQWNLYIFFGFWVGPRIGKYYLSLSSYIQLKNWNISFEISTTMRNFFTCNDHCGRWTSVFLFVFRRNFHMIKRFSNTVYKT